MIASLTFSVLAIPPNSSSKRLYVLPLRETSLVVPFWNVCDGAEAVVLMKREAREDRRRKYLDELWLRS
jgi:hypothetical protein